MREHNNSFPMSGDNFVTLTAEELKELFQVGDLEAVALTDESNADSVSDDR